MKISLSVLRKKIRHAIRESKKTEPTSASLKEDISLMAGLNPQNPVMLFLNTLLKPRKLANANRKSFGVPLFSKLSDSEKLRATTLAMYKMVVSNKLRYDDAIQYITRLPKKIDPSMDDLEKIKKDRESLAKYLRANKKEIEKGVKRISLSVRPDKDLSAEELRRRHGPQMRRPR